MALNRRKFLSSTAALGAVVMSPFQENDMQRPAFPVPSGFDVKIMATDWGINGTREQYFEKAKAEGYDGVELWWQGDHQKRKEVFDLLKKYQLEVGFLCGSHDLKFDNNLRQFKSMIDAAAGSSNQKALYINCHSGKDYFSFEENKQFIDYTISAAQKYQITIAHETHRGRILYAAPVARKFMEAIPELRLTLDISHWCNVHESFLEGQEETVEMVLQRVDHIHARVGHPEGPQVNDPRAPEWKTALVKHLAWWDKVVELKIKQGARRITFLTEFGPPDYMPTLPYTRQPLSDLWSVNVYMMQLIRNRYSGK